MPKWNCTCDGTSKEYKELEDKMLGYHHALMLIRAGSWKDENDMYRMSLAQIYHIADMALEGKI